MRPPTGRLLGGILIGGSSRRMGRPKQFIDTAGTTMIERVSSALEPLVDGTVILGHGEVPAALSNLTRLADAPGCDGPLAGILAGLRDAPDVCWVVAACDMPLVTGAAVRWLLGERRSAASMVLPRVGGRVEPLLAVYEPSALPLLEAAANAGRLALRHLARHRLARCVEPPPPLQRCWFNANTPADIERLLAC